MENKGNEISISERKIIVKMGRNGKSCQDIVRFVGQQYLSIQHAIYNLKSTRVYTSKPRLSRPPKLTIRQKRRLLRCPKNSLKESATKLGLESSFRFQHDNDPKHTAEIVKLWLLYNIQNKLQMAPQLSDLNPTEHLRDFLERRIRQDNVTNEDMLKSVLKDQWEKIRAQETTRSVILIPKRDFRRFSNAEAI
ncbi:transposable element Tcb1 transposase [Trichonephila clavipes]|uniref:Transposable element Tcb1 transposase n=1 Tax=Trichonephila clavipes TaxID=2585209 RepID=A0A8X7BJ13_TRICX|nr:transposable element Tcb1 transposase [Trichonephila clavipes]